jgi:hypothetical protein
VIQQIFVLGSPRGVSRIPMRLENEAAQMAAATLPRAIEVKAIEDCTVEGKQQRNITPV